MPVARLAALHATEVVPPGTELGFLAPLPLACLAPPPALAATLERWGIRRLGDLARLPVAEVATRLGPVGAALVRAARGEDERPLAPQTLGGPVEEAIDLEHALDALEPLLFVLRGLVERAVARVGLEGIGVARLGLALGLEDRSRDERAVPLAAPTRDVKTLLTCIRAELEARPPRAAGAWWARRARGGWWASGGATAPSRATTTTSSSPTAASTDASGRTGAGSSMACMTDGAQRRASPLAWSGGHRTMHPPRWSHDRLGGMVVPCRWSSSGTARACRRSWELCP